MTLLRIENVDAHHGLLHAVRGVSIDLNEGETLALIGANGAGKTTLLRTIAGTHPLSGGRIEFDGKDVSGIRAHKRVALGISLVPEGRRLFPGLTVEENLLLAGAYGRSGSWTLEKALDVFPLIAARRRTRAGNLSGGEQQATAIARAMMTNPKLLLLDEASLGLSPIMVDAVYDSIATLIEDRTTIVLVEQDLDRALSVSDRIACMLEGEVRLQGETGAVEREQITEIYFGMDSGGQRIRSRA